MIPKKILLLLLLIGVFIANYVVVGIVDGDPMATIVITGIFIIIYIKILQWMDEK